MIAVKKMLEAEDKYINLYFKDGTIWENKKCLYFEHGEDDEENALIFEAPCDNEYEIKQSEIEKIEILD